MADEPPPGHGTTEFSFAVIADLLTNIIIQANLGREYCGLNDRTGLVYSSRALVAYTKQAIACVKDLHPELQREDVHG